MDESLGKRSIHMVNAWASENRLVLAQQKVDEKSNKITAIPSLLEMLEIADCIITIDVMGKDQNAGHDSPRTTAA
jgi:hypothetical protein